MEKKMENEMETGGILGFKDGEVSAGQCSQEFCKDVDSPVPGLLHTAQEGQHKRANQHPTVWDPTDPM